MPGLDVTYLNLITREHFIPTLKDNIYNKYPLFNRLGAKGRMKTATGNSLIWDVIAKRHAATGRFTGYDILASQPTNPLVKGSLSSAEFYATVSISGTEERHNSGTAGAEKLLDGMKTQMDNAEATLTEDLVNGMYGDGSLVGGRMGIYGLQAVIGTSNTYAGIDRSAAANAFWRSNLDSTSHVIANLENPASTEYFGSLMRKQYLNASHKTSPDLIMTTKVLYGYYEDIAEAQHLRMDNETADLGFGDLMFKKNVPMMFDDYCPAGYLFMLRVDSFQFFAYPGANLDLQAGGWLEPPNQIAKISHILFDGQLRCDEPRANAGFSALPTA